MIHLGSPLSRKYKDYKYCSNDLVGKFVLDYGRLYKIKSIISVRDFDNVPYVQFEVFDFKTMESDTLFLQ